MSLKSLLKNSYRRVGGRNMYQDFSFHHPRPCYQCIHYRVDSFDAVHWLRNMDWTTHENVTGRCRLFDGKEVAICRRLEELCGKEGRYFDKDGGRGCSGGTIPAGYVSFN